jgi:hypothetical protein
MILSAVTPMCGHVQCSTLTDVQFDAQTTALRLLRADASSVQCIDDTARYTSNMITAL